MSATLLAAPKLRLTATTVGPLSIAADTNGPAQTVEASNVGDGSLNLQLASSVPWLVPTVGAVRPCSLRGFCMPIQIALQTASLTKGVYTGIVTVNDPAAIDAPQTITVTVQIGGGVPDRLDFFVTPNGGTASTKFTTGDRLTTSTTAPFLSVALDGSGSFQFSFPYLVTATAQPGMAEGTVNSTLAVSNSSLAADNKTIPVSLTVTSRPIAQVTPNTLQFRMAQGASKQSQAVSVSNRGLGTLAASGATATSTTGGSWLSAQVTSPTVITVTADPTGLAPGTYQGSVAIATNAANTTAVPVQLTIGTQAAPLVQYQGVVNNATFDVGDNSVSQGDIVAVFGDQFLFTDPQQATALPLSTQIGGVTVFLNDKPVPLYYVSYGQINFQIPFDAPIGEGILRVERDGQRGNSITVNIVASAPRLLRLGIGNYGLIVNNTDGSFPIPATPGINSHPAKAGDALVIYALGLGQTTPVAVSGAGAPAVEPLARTIPAPFVFFGGGLFDPGLATPPIFVGLTPNFVGLYQINVVVPEAAPKGDNVTLYIAGADASSNRVTLAIQ